MNRIILLDLLRFFAALSVVLFHYTFAGYMSNNTIMFDIQYIGSIFQYGSMGVELFFMVSGFVILLSSENKPILYFVTSRITRLYPAYWVGVTLTAIVIAIYGGEKFSVTTYQYLVNLTMINEMFHVQNIDGVYWTLFVEIRFYLLIFLLMLFRQMKYLKFYLLVWALISILYHIVTLPSLLNFFLISNVAPFFIAGAVFYMAYRNNKFSFLDYLILFLSFIASIMYLNKHISHMSEVFNHQFNMSIIFSILISFYFIFFAVSNNVFLINKDKKIYNVMGGVTYPLYLIHSYIGYIIFNNLYALMNKYVLLLSTVLLMILFSYIIHIFIEKKLGKYMKKQILQFIDRLAFRDKH